MPSPHALDKIVQEWKEEADDFEKEFLEADARGDWKTYSFKDKTNEMPDWQDLDDACKRCIYAQIQKYQDSLHRDGKPYGNRFTVPCKGIPKNYIDPKVLDYLSKSEGATLKDLEELQAVRDPVRWIKANCYFDNGERFTPRWYQEIMIRCSSRRVVFRNGRRSGKTVALAALCLWACMIQPFLARDPNTGEPILRDGETIQQKTRILILTPRQTHADNIMEIVQSFIEQNPILNQAVVKFRSSPYYIVKFANGSWIKCLTAGTGTAAAGLSARSFDADILILDEANYLGEAERKAIMAILTTNLNTMLRASSTPIGMRDFFWDWCHSNPGYKAFWFPTPVVPHWHLIQDSTYSDVETEDEFLHEYMAKFSPSATGVFRPDLVDFGIRAYRYEELPGPEPDCMYGIGVDWNSSAGTEIVVTELNTKTGIYRPVNAVNISRAVWTQLSALDKIVEFCKLYRPVVVCVDEGHGTTQIEVLQKYSTEMGHEHPAIADLRNTLIPYDFGSSIEVANPNTGEKKRKAAKPFLVQNAVRRFEEEQIHLSNDDTQLLQQIRSYEIKKRSATTGRPIYGPDKPSTGDHRLDAFMLSLVGFRLRYGNLDTPEYAVMQTTVIKQEKDFRSSRGLTTEARVQQLSPTVAAIFKAQQGPSSPVPSRAIFKPESNSRKRPSRQPIFDRRRYGGQR